MNSLIAKIRKWFGSVRSALVKVQSKGSAISL
jgi:hypothetical protein